MIHHTFLTQQHGLQLAAHAAGISTGELRLRYFSMSGNLDPLDVDADLAGLLPLPLEERNTFAIAFDELIDELPPRRRALVLSDGVSRETWSQAP